MSTSNPNPAQGESPDRRDDGTLPKDAVKSLRMGVALLKNMVEETLPKSSPGRGKRRSRSIDDHLVFVNAVDSFTNGRPSDDLLGEIKDAFADPATDVFRIITEAQKHLTEVSHSKFSRSVIECRRAWVVLDHRFQRTPTKAEVIAEVWRKLGEDATFGPEESSRWAEVFKAAGVAGELETAKPKRGKSRHG